MKKWGHTLVLVLLLSVSTQALSIVFDSHSSHQNSEFHLSDADQPLTDISDPAKGLADNTGLDCQHCCHCHSAQHIFLLFPFIQSLPSDGYHLAQRTLTQPPADGFWRNLLRPPIA